MCVGWVIRESGLRTRDSRLETRPRSRRGSVGRRAGVAPARARVRTRVRARSIAGRPREGSGEFISFALARFRAFERSRRARRRGASIRREFKRGVVAAREDERLAHGKRHVRRSVAVEGVWGNVHTRGSSEIGERRVGAGGGGAGTRGSTRGRFKRSPARRFGVGRVAVVATRALDD